MFAIIIKTSTPSIKSIFTFFKLSLFTTRERNPQRFSILSTKVKLCSGKAIAKGIPGHPPPEPISANSKTDFPVEDESSENAADKGNAESEAAKND